MAVIRQFNERSMRQIARVVRQSDRSELDSNSGRHDLRDDSYWVRINAWSEDVADAQWSYTVIIQRGGAATDDGLEDATETTYPARNTWESRLTNAGYENGSVSGLYPIPIDSIVRAWFGAIDGVTTMIFSERNEPRCD